MKPDAKRSAQTTGALPILREQTACHSAQDTGWTSGLVRDTRVVTARGLRKVQDLRSADLLIVRDKGLVPIQRIDRKSMVARAVYVIAGSLGHRQFDRDTLLPAGQMVLVRDWRARALTQHSECLAEAARLADGEFVRDIGFQPMTVYRIFCDRQHVIYAEGMELGTAE